jgi:hypothetical protein
MDYRQHGICLHHELTVPAQDAAKFEVPDALSFCCVQ